MDAITVDYQDDRLSLRYGDVLVVEPEDADWYAIVPTKTLVGTFARLFEQIGICSPDAAREEAELFLRCLSLLRSV
jgi:hypothetical protein